MIAAQLRQHLRALPLESRRRHEDSAIRLWRAVSWLERAEPATPTDLEGRFIAAWIGFNALYGRLDREGRPWGDREAQSTFLARIWRVDHEGRLDRWLHKRQLPILRLLEDKFLSPIFWEQGNGAAKQVQRELREVMTWFGTSRAPKVMHVLCERLYVLRNQVLHGASTRGSSLNRRVLREGGNILMEFLTIIIEVMLTAGLAEDWGDVCYRPAGRA